jgi:hypothetical protein
MAANADYFDHLRPVARDQMRQRIHRAASEIARAEPTGIVLWRLRAQRVARECAAAR